MSGLNALQVLDSQIAELRASGDTGNVENLLEVREAVAAVFKEAQNVLDREWEYGEDQPHCVRLDAALARCGATP